MLDAGTPQTSIRYSAYAVPSCTTCPVDSSKTGSPCGDPPPQISMGGADLDDVDDVDDLDDVDDVDDVAARSSAAPSSRRSAHGGMTLSLAK